MARSISLRPRIAWLPITEFLSRASLWLAPQAGGLRYENPSPTLIEIGTLASPFDQLTHPTNSLHESIQGKSTIFGALQNREPAREFGYRSAAAHPIAPVSAVIQRARNSESPRRAGRIGSQPHPLP